MLFVVLGGVAHLDYLRIKQLQHHGPEQAKADGGIGLFLHIVGAEIIPGLLSMIEVRGYFVFPAWPRHMFTNAGWLHLR